MIYATTKSAEETQLLAAGLSQVVRDGDFVLLTGEMGAGKTTFTQGFGRALGVSDPITSPTFVLVQSYAGKLPLHHVDVYRLEHLQEIVDLGLIELVDAGGVALIEWGNVAAPSLPRDFLEIVLEVDPDDDELRHFQFQCVGNAWTGREKAINEVVVRWVVPGPEEER